MARHLPPYDADFQRVYYEDPNTVNVVFPDGGFLIFDNLPTASHNAPGRHRFDQHTENSSVAVFALQTSVLTKFECPREWHNGVAVKFEYL